MTVLRSWQKEGDKRMTKEELYNKRNVAYDKADGIFDVACLEARRIQDEACLRANKELQDGLAKLAGKKGNHE